MQMFTALYGLETVTHPLLQRVRPAPGSLVAVLGRHLAVHHAPCVEGRRPTIYGDGEQTRDFTYVANVVDGVLRAVRRRRASAGKVINVATGGRISLNELFATLRDARRRDRRRPCTPTPRAGDVRDSQADITRRPRAPRLRADRVVRRRPAPDRRVVHVHAPAGMSH